MNHPYNGRVVVQNGTVYFHKILIVMGISSVEVQISDQWSRSQGLMDVRKLPENHGMLFKFDTEEPLSLVLEMPTPWISLR